MCLPTREALTQAGGLDIKGLIQPNLPMTTVAHASPIVSATICKCKYTYTSTICMCVYISMYTYICMCFVNVCECICTLYIYMHICTDICMFIHTHACMHAYIHSLIQAFIHSMHSYIPCIHTNGYTCMDTHAPLWPYTGIETHVGMSPQVLPLSSMFQEFSVDLGSPANLPKGSMSPYGACLRCIYIYMYICICMYVHATYIHVCMYIYIYTCTYACFRTIGP